MAIFETDYKMLIEHFANPLPSAPQTYDYVIEECAELIQEIQHVKRNRKDVNAIKEMAHVYTLMDALKIYWQIPDTEIRKYQQELIDRYLYQPNDGRHISLVNQTKED